MVLVKAGMTCGDPASPCMWYYCGRASLMHGALCVCVCVCQPDSCSVPQPPVVKTEMVTISDTFAAQKTEIATKEVPIVHTETKTITYEAAQVALHCTLCNVCVCTLCSVYVHALQCVCACGCLKIVQSISFYCLINYLFSFMYRFATFSG